MLDAFFVGLIVNGAYHLAQIHREHLKQTKAAKEISKEDIRNSLENSLKSIFPKLSKDFPELKGIDEDQIKSVQELFYRSDGELEDMLRKTITDSLYSLSSSEYVAGETVVDMFSVEGYERALIELKERKNLKSLKSETVSSTVPRIYFQILQEISKQPALNNVVDLIRECQKAKFREEVILKLEQIQKYDQLDDETILSAVNTARQKLKARATRLYDIKLVGREPNVTDRFDYMPPRMQRVVKQENRIPVAFEDNTKPIDLEAFHQLFLEKKKVLILAGAGVGKTTFLHRMQLELIQKRLKEAPLPVFENVSEFFNDTGTLFDRTVRLLQNTQAIDFSREKAERIAGILNESGRLCFLLDALDQSADDGSCKIHFQMDATGIFEKNRVVVASRVEHIKRDPEVFRDIFSSYEWFILEGFREDDLVAYLELEVDNWLRYHLLSKNFKELLRTPFYANVTRQIGLEPEIYRKRLDTRGQLLHEFENRLFREARLRKGVSIHDLDVSKIQTLLYRLSLETLTDKHIQTFPYDYLDRYQEKHADALKVIFDVHWVYFNRTLFEGRDGYRCTFYHKLLQEYFAACRLNQLFNKDPESFDKALTKLPFSPVIFGLLDYLLPHEPVFNHCMDRFKTALSEADRDKKGLEGTGNKFTWLLALRDEKGEKPELKERLQEIFDEEKEQSQKGAVTDGKFVKIPASAFLMGGYEYDFVQPVRVVYVPDYWISRYAETFREYYEYCRACGKEKPIGHWWERVEDQVERPVINVSWNDAQGYLIWMGKNYTLPTEAQWEKASRGRLGRKYPWGNDEPDRIICNFNGAKTFEVQKFDPQMYGNHQMAGNVLEWCTTKWQPDYKDYEQKVDNNPEGDDGRVMRGGSFYGGPGGLPGGIRCAFRIVYDPCDRYNHFGFRVVSPGF